MERVREANKYATGRVGPWGVFFPSEDVGLLNQKKRLKCHPQNYHWAHTGL